jgi:small-conductance mechanosensitive channel
MKFITFTENCRRPIVVSMFLSLMLCCLTVLPAAAQLLNVPVKTVAVESSWSAPDLASLPSDWWSQIQTDSVEVAERRVDEFLGSMELRTLGLNATDLITAQNGIANLKSQFELLALAKQGPLEQQFTPPLAKESYFLKDVLGLRAQWRELAVAAAQVNLQIEQTERLISLLQQRRDKLLREYDSVDTESPSRILIGIQRITARVEFALATIRAQNFRENLKQIEEQSSLVSEQQAFAQDHLVSSNVTIAELEKTVQEARAKVTEMNEKVTALQPQLLSVLSSDSINTSLELLRKQQLTRASAEAQLAHLQEMQANYALTWYQFRAGILDPDYDIQSAQTETRRSVDDSLKQAELWSSISQSTLITPPTDKSLNTVKNFEIALSVARETLTLIDEIKSAGDDLLLTQQIFTSELLSGESGIHETGARLSFALGNSWDRVIELAGYHLFSIGDTSVTPAGVFKMLLIMGLAIGISALIRYFLARGLRRNRTPQSPAFYTMGRLLHYIIVMAGVFAALGSIGIDFTSFALIAGALSVGIGFGLQAIVSNFVSGLILLFEGTLRVGDFIELDTEFGLRGVVKEINTRATVINTNDGVDLVVPNSVLVTTQLTNWTLRQSYGRLRVSFGVAYGTDKELVKKAALEAVSEVESAITHMPGLEPQVRLSNFGDSALEFTVLFWVSRQGVRRPGRTRASFLWALETLLNEYGVEIPFPQRDLHIKSGSGPRQEPGAEPEFLEVQSIRK